jgi:hypothetical protein
MVFSLVALAPEAAQGIQGQGSADPPRREGLALDRTTAAPPPTRVDVPAGEDTRYWRVLKALAESLNAEDREGFLALFSQRLVTQRAAAGDPITGALEFMSRAMARRGNIDRFHALAPDGLQAAGSSQVVRIAVFLLEDGMTGYFGVALDEQGLIDDFSYFLLPDLCAGGGPRCQGEPIPLAALPVGE